jgi:hypothetical protein
VEAPKKGFPAAKGRVMRQGIQEVTMGEVLRQERMVGVVAARFSGAACFTSQIPESETAPSADRTDAQSERAWNRWADR